MSNPESTDRKPRNDHPRWSLFPLYTKRVTRQLKDHVMRGAVQLLGASEDDYELLVGVSYRCIATAERLLAVLVTEAETELANGTKPFKAYRHVNEFEALVSQWTYDASEQPQRKRQGKPQGEPKKVAKAS